MPRAGEEADPYASSGQEIMSTRLQPPPTELQRSRMMLITVVTAVPRALLQHQQIAAAPATREKTDAASSCCARLRDHTVAARERKTSERMPHASGEARETAVFVMERFKWTYRRGLVHAVARGGPKSTTLEPGRKRGADASEWAEWGEDPCNVPEVPTTAKVNPNYFMFLFF